MWSDFCFGVYELQEFANFTGAMFCFLSFLLSDCRNGWIDGLWIFIYFLLLFLAGLLGVVGWSAQPDKVFSYSVSRVEVPTYLPYFIRAFLHEQINTCLLDLIADNELVHILLPYPTTQVPKPRLALHRFCDQPAKVCCFVHDGILDLAMNHQWVSELTGHQSLIFAHLTSKQELERISQLEKEKSYCFLYTIL